MLKLESVRWRIWDAMWVGGVEGEVGWGCAPLPTRPRRCCDPTSFVEMFLVLFTPYLECAIWLLFIVLPYSRTSPKRAKFADGWARAALQYYKTTVQQYFTPTMTWNPIKQARPGNYASCVLTGSEIRAYSVWHMGWHMDELTDKLQNTCIDRLIQYTISPWP